MVEEYNNSHSTATSIDKAPVLGRNGKVIQSLQSKIAKKVIVIRKRVMS